MSSSKLGISEDSWIIWETHCTLQLEEVLDAILSLRPGYRRKSTSGNTGNIGSFLKVLGPTDRGLCLSSYRETIDCISIIPILKKTQMSTSSETMLSQHTIRLWALLSYRAQIRSICSFPLRNRHLSDVSNHPRLSLSSVERNILVYSFFQSRLEKILSSFHETSDFLLSEWVSFEITLGTQHLRQL